MRWWVVVGFVRGQVNWRELQSGLKSWKVVVGGGMPPEIGDKALTTQKGAC